MSELDILGALHGTDKSSSVSWAWDYLRHYEEIFAKWRHAKINLIEIGVLGGSSLATWSGFFDQATLVGIDINPDCRRFAGGRTVIRIGSQDDAAFLSEVAAAYPPTIVIDDGSHLAHHMIASFEALFPALMPGGVYVFEDLSFHFEDGGGQWLGAQAHQGQATTSIYEYLARFVRARAANQAAPKGSAGFARYAFETIDWVTVFGGVLVVRKRAPRDIGADVAAFERALSQPDFNKRLVAYRFAEFLYKADHDLPRAADLVRAALVTVPPDEYELVVFFRIMVKLGRLDEAAAATQKLLEVNRMNSQWWELVADVERRRGNLDLECQAWRHLVQVRPDHAWFRYCLSHACERLGDLAAALTPAREASALEPQNEEYRRRVAALEARQNA